MTHGRALGVLLRSIIVEREPVYRQQQTVHGLACALFGLTAEQITHLSDDRIGRALDRLFDADRAALLTEVVVSIGQRFAVNFERLHNDSTSIAFCGQYRAAKGREIWGRRTGDNLRLLEGSPRRSEAAAVHPDGVGGRCSRRISRRRGQHR